MMVRLEAVGSTRYKTGTSGIGCLAELRFLFVFSAELCQLFRIAHRCMVTPHPLRSLTRSTLLMTSLPRLSNTRTFHIGSPSEFRIGVALGMRPLTADGSCWVVEGSGEAWLRLRIFSREAVRTVSSALSSLYLDSHGGLPTCRSRRDCDCVTIVDDM